jgi:hypothetical protein
LLIHIDLVVDAFWYSSLWPQYVVLVSWSPSRALDSPYLKCELFPLGWLCIMLRAYLIDGQISTWIFWSNSQSAASCLRLRRVGINHLVLRSSPSVALCDLYCFCMLITCIWLWCWWNCRWSTKKITCSPVGDRDSERSCAGRRSATTTMSTPCAFLPGPPCHPDQQLGGMRAPLPRPSWWPRLLAVAAAACLHRLVLLQGGTSFISRSSSSVFLGVLSAS